MEVIYIDYSGRVIEKVSPVTAYVMEKRTFITKSYLAKSEERENERKVLITQ